MTLQNGLKTNNGEFIPAGYLYKKIVKKPAWIEVDLEDIYSVSGCISKFFTDYINYWQHNDYWLFDSPAIMEKIASKNGLNLTDTELFYYEVYELEFDEKNNSWTTLQSEWNIPTQVIIPPDKVLKGFDAVSFYAKNIPECSPLSCCSLATSINVNKHCLFNTFNEAKQALNDGLFKNAEPGPYRIFAVYTVTN